MKNKTIADEIRALEEKLLTPSIRKSRDELEILLADDFMEFGSSGVGYSKPEIIEALQRESEERCSLSSFHAKVLAPGVVLATYVAVRSSSEPQSARRSLRSSIWRRERGSWRIVFHQGTPATD